MTQGTDTTSFSYGPNRELIKRIDVRSTGTTTTLMLDGYEQITLPSGVVEHKYNVGDAVITKRSNGANETYYLHKDQQGSTTAITNAAGTTVQQFLYDPWGKQYLVNNSLLTYTSPATSKGYTGHEMVNDFEIIHMGGRTYNPVLGRFMQADPFIQAPENLQSYNRYSYVLNNPMSYTDPSGYFFKKIGSFLKKYWKPILAVVATVVTYGAASGWAYGWGMTQGFQMTVMGTTSTFVTGLSTAGAITAGAISGAVGGFVGGALATGSVTGALRGATSGAIAGAAGGYANLGSATSFGDAVGRIAVSATGGCGASVASGGSCGRGAGLAAMAQSLKVSSDYLAGDNSSFATADGEAVVKPGGALKAKLLSEGKNVDWINNSVDNTGMGVTVSSEQYSSLVGMTVSEARATLLAAGIAPEKVLSNLGPMGESGHAMSWLSQNIGGVRSASVMHDRAVGVIERAIGMENTWYGTVFTVGSIPPAFAVQYAALGVASYDYYYRKLPRR